MNALYKNGFHNKYQKTMMLRKIPLEKFIEILQDLYDGGADYVDLSGGETNEGETLVDSIKITVKPEYLSDFNEDVDCTELSNLSDDDINDLI